MIQSDHRPEHLVAFAADQPLSAVRDFHDQPAYVQSLQHSTYRVAPATAFPGFVDRFIQRFPDVGVAESTHQVVAIQHRTEQLLPNSPVWNGTQFGSLERMAKRLVVQRTVTT